MTPEEFEKLESGDRVLVKDFEGSFTPTNGVVSSVDRGDNPGAWIDSWRDGRSIFCFRSPENIEY